MNYNLIIRVYTLEKKSWIKPEYFGSWSFWLEWAVFRKLNNLRQIISCRSQFS